MSEEKLEQKLSYEVITDRDKVPEKYRNSLKDGELFVTVKALDTEFLPEPWLRELADDSRNQRILWRHKDPENEKDRGRVYGRILDSYVKSCPKTNKPIMQEHYRVFGGPDNSPEKDLQDLLLKKEKDEEPLGVSKGYIVNRNKNGDIYRVFALEDSFTYKPKCKTCLTQEVITMEKDTDKDLKKEITDLQEKLNKAKLQLEDKDEAVEQLESKVEKFESALETTTTEKLSLEDRLIELSDQIKKFQDKFDYLQKKPYLDKLEELEDPEIFELEKGRDIEWLKERLQKRLKEKDGPQVETKTLEQERADSLEEDEEEEVVPVPLAKAFSNNPKMMKDIAVMKQEDSKLGIEGAWY